MIGPIKIACSLEMTPQAPGSRGGRRLSDGEADTDVGEQWQDLPRCLARGRGGPAEPAIAACAQESPIPGLAWMDSKPSVTAAARAGAARNATVAPWSLSAGAN